MAHSSPTEVQPGSGKIKTGVGRYYGSKRGGECACSDNSSPPAISLQSWPFSFVIAKNAENYCVKLPI